MNHFSKLFLAPYSQLALESQLPIKKIVYYIQIIPTYKSVIEKVSIKTLQAKLTQNLASLPDPKTQTQ